MANNQSRPESDIPFNTPQADIDDILSEVEDLPEQQKSPPATDDILFSASQTDIDDILSEVEDIPGQQPSPPAADDILFNASQTDIDDILSEVEDIPGQQPSPPAADDILFNASQTDIDDILSEVEDIPEQQPSPLPTDDILFNASQTDIDDILSEVEDIPEQQPSPPPVDILLTTSQTDIDEILSEVEDLSDQPSQQSVGVPLSMQQTNIQQIQPQVQDSQPQARPLEVPLLAASGLYKSFGGIKAVDNAEIEVKKGSITGLIGPNGAGKTTLFNLLSNFIRPDRGRVIFDGEPIQHLQPHQIAQMGMVRTFQVARVLSKLSVMENMVLAAQKQTGENFWNVWFKSPQIKAEERQLREEAMRILESVGLAHMANEYAGALSGGQRKLLEMGRALMTQPKLILLDEPAAGVNPTLIKQICDRIVSWNREGMTFLIIEHNMDVIMSLCDRVWVLAEGHNLAVGTPTEIQNNSQVLEAYLGQ